MSAFDVGSTMPWEPEIRHSYMVSLLLKTLYNNRPFREPTSAASLCFMISQLFLVFNVHATYLLFV